MTRVSEPVFDLTLNPIAGMGASSRQTEYECVHIDYGDSLHYCIYTIRIKATNEIVKLPISILFKKIEWMEGFSITDMQRICLDYANAVEVSLHRLLLNRHNLESAYVDC